MKILKFFDYCFYRCASSKFAQKLDKEEYSHDDVVLYKQYLRYETNSLYLVGISEIWHRGIDIQGIVCDSRQGLFGLFDDISIQMCQFYQ